MKIVNNTGSCVIEIPGFLEKQVLEFLELTKLLKTAQQLGKDDLLTLNDIDRLYKQFRKHEQAMVNLLDDGTRFADYYWMLEE
jgi:hypothetical protein